MLKLFNHGISLSLLRRVCWLFPRSVWCTIGFDLGCLKVRFGRSPAALILLLLKRAFGGLEASGLQPCQIEGRDSGLKKVHDGWVMIPNDWSIMTGQ